MTLWHGNAFQITGPFFAHGFPSQMASNVESLAVIMKDVTAILVAGDNQFSFELRKIWKNFTIKKKIMENGCSMKTHFFFQGVSHPVISVNVT